MGDLPASLSDRMARGDRRALAEYKAGEREVELPANAPEMPNLPFAEIPVWVATIDVLAKMGTLTVADGPLIERYVKLKSLHDRLASELLGGQPLTENIDGVDKPRVEWTMLMKVTSELSKAEQQLGLTPVMRNRVRQAKTTTKKTAEAELLARAPHLRVTGS